MCHMEYLVSTARPPFVARALGGLLLALLLDVEVRLRRAEAHVRVADRRMDAGPPDDAELGHALQHDGEAEEVDREDRRQAQVEGVGSFRRERVVEEEVGDLRRWRGGGKRRSRDGVDANGRRIKPGR